MQEIAEMLGMAFVIGLTGALAPGPTLLATVNSLAAEGWRAGPKVAAPCPGGGPDILGHRRWPGLGHAAVLPWDFHSPVAGPDCFWSHDCEWEPERRAEGAGGAGKRQRLSGWSCHQAPPIPTSGSGGCRWEAPSCSPASAQG